MRESSVDAPDESYPLNGANMTLSISTIPLGTCQCGCGNPTKIAERTHTALGIFRGIPLRYIFGHQGRIRLIPEECDPFTVEGEPCHSIPLTQGQVAIVDAIEYQELIQVKWRAIWNEGCKTFYAARQLPRQEGMPRKGIWMHRQILGLENSDKRQGDHINHNGLDNRRSNIRIATCSQNQANTRTHRDNKSGYKGVFWHKDRRKWSACIMHDGKRYFLGYFDTAEEARAAYCAAALRFHGEFARIA